MQPPGEMNDGMNRANINAHPSWLLGAPVTKAFVTAMAVSYVMAEMFDSHSLMVLDIDGVSNDGEFWRIITSQVVFGSIAELVFGIGVLCPLMRRFEREMGSRKYGTFLIYTSILSTTWDLALAQIFHNTTPASGPYGLLGGHLLLYHEYTPRLYPRFFGILGFDFSEKSLTYLFASQLLFSGGVRTILPSVSGFIAGFLCSTPILPVTKWELPEFFYRFCGAIGGGFIESAPRVVRRRRPDGIGAGARQRLIPPERIGRMPMAQPVPQPVAPPPPEEMIESLTSMGFDRERVVRVLRQTGNNVELAANQLLSE